MISTTITVRADQPQGVIDPNIYGQFAEHLGRCIYEGIWVGEDSPIANTRGIRSDVVDALTQLQIPVLRWPGGCFADEYHWRDGIGPRTKRPDMINTHWGGTVENNHFGTHEFFDLCAQLGCKSYICGNVGSGTPREMMEWVEYITSNADSPMARLRRQNGRELAWKLDYFGVGNESWGCGGNMRPEYYADEYRRYNTFVKNYGGVVIERFACGANRDDYHWTRVLMERASGLMNGLSLHYYTLPNPNWLNKGAATGFDEAAWHETLWQALQMEILVNKHGAIMDHSDPEKRVGMIIDEWGTWYDVEPGTEPGWLYQQNSMRDALVAAISLNIFHAHADRVKMTNIAQMVNVLQAMILTDKERMVLTPTYHVFEMYKVHQGATSLPLELQAPDYQHGEKIVPMVHASASRDAQGTIHLSLANLHPQETIALTVRLAGSNATGAAGQILTSAAMDAHNTFEQPHVVKPQSFSNIALAEGKITLTLPAKSVLTVTLR